MSCSAPPGFPMVFTRTLTLQQLPASAYYGYLALYNLIYVLSPLATWLIARLTRPGRNPA